MFNDTIANNTLKYIIFVFYPGTNEYKNKDGYVQALETKCSDKKVELKKDETINDNSVFYIDCDDNKIQKYADN